MLIIAKNLQIQSLIFIFMPVSGFYADVLDVIHMVLSWPYNCKYAWFRTFPKSKTATKQTHAGYGKEQVLEWCHADSVCNLPTTCRNVKC